MKAIYWIIAIVGITGALAAHAGDVGGGEGNRGGRYTRETYLGSCKYNHPLDAFELCTPYSEAGQEALDCARREARLRCREAGAVDCQLLGVNFHEIFSKEFIGYKSCEAKVIYSGFLNDSERNDK